MSDTKSPKTVKIHKLPFVIKKNALRTHDKLNSNYELLFRCVQNATKNLFKEDILYKSSDRDIFYGKYPDLTITNKLNILKNISRTVATYKGEDSTVIELTSDAVTKVIGQKNYDKLFSALCSVISQDLKIQGIFSLLSPEKVSPNEVVHRRNISSQTDETSRDILLRDKRKRHIKKKGFTSYIVNDDMLPKKRMKRVIIDPSNLLKPDQIKPEPQENTEKNPTKDDPGHNGQNNENSNQLPDLKLILDEDSNISDTSISNISIVSSNIPDLLENPKTILNNIDKHTKEVDPDDLTAIKVMDGSYVMIHGNPDIFHLASPEILERLSGQDRNKILLHQAYIDWKYCLQPNDEGDLPIHFAVLNDDVELLKRQCIVLKTRNTSVDVESEAKMTALRIALLNDRPKCTVVLLSHGADPLVPDEEARTPLHLASEVSSENVQAILDHCRANAKEILKDDEGLWQDHFESQPEKNLAEYLLYKMCTIFDNQGYIPLMLASRIGSSENVKLLIQAAPNAINMGMPNSGNTALYLAVGSACLECNSGGNKTVVATNYLDTISALVENGADPGIDNNSGVNVNTLLTEFNIFQLSMLIANKLTSVKYFGGNEVTDFDSYMLLKESDGKINLRELKVKKCEKEEEGGVKSNVAAVVKVRKNNDPLKSLNKSKAKSIIVVQKDNRTKPSYVTVERNRPLILKKVKPLNRNVVDTTKLITIKSQNVAHLKNSNEDDKPKLQRVNVMDPTPPLKFVKIMPRVVDVRPGTSGDAVSKKRKSNSKCDDDVKKPKV